MTDTTNFKLRIGISQCLLGDHVRYDGSHKYNAFLSDVLAPYVEWIPVCPEVEAGLGTPRETMHLVGNANSPRLLTIHTNVDHTETLKLFSQGRVQLLRKSNLDGYIFKGHSPSCGAFRVKVYDRKHLSSKHGKGIFSALFQKTFPYTPVEEEGRLKDVRTRVNFFERIICYRRWKALFEDCRVSRRAIEDFHTRHTYVLLAHSRTHYKVLEQLVESTTPYTPTQLAKRYKELFMEALKVKPTVNKHVNVLQHSAGILKQYLNTKEWTEVQKSIADYHDQLHPLTTPLALIKDFAQTRAVPLLKDQVFLNPHPMEILLSNHV